VSREFLVGYRVLPAYSGMRVWSDGAVELAVPGEGWRESAGSTTRPWAGTRGECERQAIAELPAVVPAPSGFRDGSDCEWMTDLGRRRVVGLIRAWFDGFRSCRLGAKPGATAASRARGPSTRRI
jgi:hypothetical protein